jgi:hypothetical protein
MKPRSHEVRQGLGWVAVAAVVAAMGAGGCAAVKAPSAAQPVAKVQTGAPGEVKRVTLTQQGFDRLTIKTAAVREVPGVAGAPAKKAVPYSALLYDGKGVTWVFTQPQPLSFVRQRVVVETVASGDAVLSDGPAVGTAVVTVGAAELFSTELGIGG